MVKRLVGTMAVGVFIVAGLESHANAFSQPIGIKIIRIRMVADACTWLTMVAKPYPASYVPLPGSDPSDLGGSLRVMINDRDLTFNLEGQRFDGFKGWMGLGIPPGCSGWRYRESDYHYIIVVIRRNLIKVKADLGDGWSINGAGFNTDLAMQLDAGNDSYCALAAPPYLKEIANNLLMTKHVKSPADCHGAEDGHLASDEFSYDLP